MTLTDEDRAKGVRTLKAQADQHARDVVEASKTRTGRELAAHLGVTYESARRILTRSRRRLEAIAAAGRPWSDPSQPGRRDAEGVEWWACDPYPTWYRWENGQLLTPPASELISVEGERTHHWLGGAAS